MVNVGIARMEKQELKLLGSKIVQGSFKELSQVLASRPKCFSEKEALYLIVCCCKSCHSYFDNCDKLNEEQLISSVIALSKIIKTVSDEEYDNYLQSIFYISKLLIKKNYQLLLEIENEILPQFMPRVLTPKQETCYKSICNLIQNVIIQLPKDKILSDEKKIIALGNFLSRIIIKTLNGTIFMEYVFKYGYCLSHLNINLEVQYEFFLYNTRAFKALKTNNSTYEISNLLKFGLHLFSSYVNQSMVTNALKCIDEMMHFIPEVERTVLRQLLKFCKFLIDPDMKHISDGEVALMEFLKSPRKSDEIHTICKLVTQVMFSFVCSYSRNGRKVFTDPEKHIIVYNILSMLMEIFLKILEPCTEDCKCLSKSRSEATDLASSIGAFFLMNISTNDLSKEYISKVKSLLKRNHEIWASQMKNGCLGFKKYWLVTEPYLYNSSVFLYRAGNHGETISFLNMILKYNNSLLGDHLESGILLNVFCLFNSIYLKEKRYKDALLWTALEIYHTKDESSRRKLFSRWVKIKSMCREENLSDLQEFTIISIIEAIPQGYACYTKPLQSKESQVNLLISELEVYRTTWKSKVSMMSSFRHLCQIACKETVMKVFVETFTDEGMRAHEIVIELSRKIFDGIEDECNKNVDNELMLYFSFYLHFVYQHQTVEMISDNLKEMERIEKLTKKRKNTDADMVPTDAYEQCDVVSLYSHLKLDGKKLKHLEKALDILERIFSTNIYPCFFKDVEPRRVYDLFIKITIEFVLHSDEYRSLRSLALAYNLAKFLGNECLLLECSGYFLRHMHISGFTERLQGFSESFMETQRNNECLIEYYINSAHFYIFNKDFSQSQTYYNNAKNILGKLKEQGVKNSWLFEVNMELLLFKLLHRAKSMKIKMEMKFTCAPLLKAYNLIAHKYRTEPIWTNKLMITLLEVLDCLIKMYHDERRPREVRCFGRQCLTLTQQNLIPVRSAKILSYLAYADLWSEKLDDCRVKLDGISDILLLDKSERCKIFTEKKCEGTSVDEVTIGIKDIMLDTPSAPTFNIQSCPASPALQVQAYNSPIFTKHSVCECFHCTSSECQKVVLYHYHLEALWYMHKRQITLADSYFKGTFKLHEKISERRKHRIKVFHDHLSTFSTSFYVLPGDLHDDITSFNEIKMYASIGYIKFLAHSGSQDAAKKFCDEGLQNFDDAKLYYPHLYGEMLFQKLGLLRMLEDKNREQRLDSHVDVIDTSYEVKVKTPETSMKNIRNPEIKNVKTKFLAPKMIKFNLSDSDPNKTPLKNTKNSTDVEGTPLVLTIPPSLRHITTPNLKTPKSKVTLNGESKEIDFSDNNLNDNRLGETPSKINHFKTPKPADVKPKPKKLDTIKMRTLSRKDIFSDEEKKLTSLENNPEKIEEKKIRPECFPNGSEKGTTDLNEKTKLLRSKLRKKDISENGSSKSDGIGNEKDIQAVRGSRRNRT